MPASNRREPLRGQRADLHSALGDADLRCDQCDPDQQHRRLLSVRAYDARDHLVDAEVAPGTELGALIGRFFAAPPVAYLHVHNARRGCYACRVDRALRSCERRESVYQVGAADAGTFDATF